VKVVAVQAAAAPEAVGGYAQALALEGVRRWLFVSGQVPESSGGEVPPDFRAQARLVWSNLLAQLEAADMSVANLAKVTTFLASREHADVNGEVRREFLGSHTPALTVVIAGIFDERWLLEIEAVAAA
jgi:2-iminobutanoate/2-iminopropanoate deaminase